MVQFLVVANKALINGNFCLDDQVFSAFEHKIFLDRHHCRDTIITVMMNSIPGCADGFNKILPNIDWLLA